MTRLSRGIDTKPYSPNTDSSQNTGVPGTEPENAALRDNWRRDWWPFLVVCLQLVLALLVIQQFRLETRTFFRVAALMVGGFAVHALLPFRLRQGFFAGLSVASVFVVFGGETGVRLAGLSALLIGACHLPIRFAARVGVIGAIGLLLAVLRVNGLPWLVPPGGLLPSAAWAILGSMFMFRLALYLDALRTRAPDDPPPTFARTVAYFFMAPNVTFPLFPVIDYNRFARNYYDRPALEIYRTGVRWIARGLLHLLLYRLVYKHFSSDPTRLRDLGDVMQFVLATYLLYLRVSGTFHLAVGLLNLFGYNLPETHHLYYLADSFNDYWRRINIYWKDFMMKLVYYPSFFRLRKIANDNTRALVGATIVVFAGTWVLHSYQWFWLRGDFPIKTTDWLFWAILGGLVVWNAVRESKRGRKRATSTASERWSWSRAVRVTTTFAIICFLWSLWSADTMMNWLVMLRAATVIGLADVALLIVSIGLGLAVAGWQWDTPAVAAGATLPWYRSPGVTTSSVLLVLLALAQPEVQRLLGARAGAIVASLERTSLNARDAATMHRGYYEKMDLAVRQSNELWEAAEERPENFLSFMQTEGSRPRDDFMKVDNRPSTTVVTMGVPISINRWGMRGAEAELAKPAGTVRIAFSGPSYMFGVSVPDTSTLPSFLERRANTRLSGPGKPRYEAMNFAVGGTSIAQMLAMLDERAFQFEPDIVVISIDSLVPSALIWHLTDILDRGVSVPYPGLARLLTEAGIEIGPSRGPRVPFGFARTLARAVGMDVRMPRPEIEQRVMMAVDTIMVWSLREIARTVRAHGALPVAAVIDLVPSGPLPTSRQYRRVLDEAAAAGFVMADLRDTWERGGFASELRVASWDNHPSALGYQLLADRLLEEFQRQNVLTYRRRP